jgi:putative NADH-flavin reductase
MRIALFGAHGRTGLQLTRQALDHRHTVVAVTRRPTEFPVDHPRLTIAGAEVSDREAVADAIAGADAVLSTLGVPFTRKPLTVYSAGLASIVAGMERHGVKRVVVVSSAATDPRPHAQGGFLLNRVMQPLVTATIGRTTYADMHRMESFLHDTNLDWTVMRPAGLFDAEAVSDYRLEEDHSEGVFTSRADLAASMLAVLESPAWVCHDVAVTTSTGAPTVLQLIRREALGGRPSGSRYLPTTEGVR